jgi:hypothetical protein
VKILDFGLAMMGTDSMEATDERETGFVVTAKGTTVGTGGVHVARASPRGNRGCSYAICGRSAWCSMRWSTRTRPFDGADIRKMGFLNRFAAGKSPVPVRERNPKISPEVERIIGRLLEKDREIFDNQNTAADLRCRP